MTTRRAFRRPTLLALAAVALLLWPAGLRPVASSAAGACPWMDPSMTADARANLLLAAMSIDDKISMVHNQEVLYQHYGVAGYIPGIPALCIPDLVLNDAGQGVGDQVQLTTAFPSGISQAASWDPVAQAAVGREIGSQAWQKGVNVQLAPNVNIARVPLNGRNFEAFGEDPYLTGQTGAAVITGIQQNAVIADIKHYAANNQETNRMTSSSNVDERTLHEIYFPAFEAAVKQGHVGSAMCSYNLINGVYACENPVTQNQVMKQLWGFDGFIMSDWGATHSTVNSANNGLDMEMNISPGTYFAAPLKTAVTVDHTVSQARLDDMVLRITRAMFRWGLFDHPAPSTQSAELTNVDTPASQVVARRAAEQGAVLLKNEGAILPVPASGKKIALIGFPALQGGADLVYNGGGSSHVPEASTKPGVVSPLQGMITTAGGDTIVSDTGASTVTAAAVAGAADVAVVFVMDGESEGQDRVTLGLDGRWCTLFGCSPVPIPAYDQNALVQAVAAANPNTVVVLTTGGPVLMPWLSQVKGVLEAWYPGEQMGNAIANLLVGNVNPSGKLPETFPRSDADIPAKISSDLQIPYSEGLNVGYRAYDSRGIEPLFPFGHGLSYTSFTYSNYKVTSSPGGGAPATISYDVSNAGGVAGSEVSQVYVGAPSPNPAGEPLKQLRGYRKTALAAGQAAHVTVPIDSRAVSYWDTSVHNWAVEPGCHPVLVGSSSRDIRLQGMGLDGNLQACVLGATSTNPVGGGTPTTGATPPPGVLPAGAALVLASLALLAGAAARTRSTPRPGPARRRPRSG